MRPLKANRFGITALLVILVGASSAFAQSPSRTSAQPAPAKADQPEREPTGGSHLVVWVTPSGSGATPRNFDIEIKDDKIIGVSMIGPDGRKEPLKPQNGPTPPGAKGCGSGKKLNCWEDEQKAISICLCFGPGDIKGRPQPIIN